MQLPPHSLMATRGKCTLPLVIILLLMFLIINVLESHTTLETLPQTRVVSNTGVSATLDIRKDLENMFLFFQGKLREYGKTQKEIGENSGNLGKYKKNQGKHREFAKMPKIRKKIRKFGKTKKSGGNRGICE